MSVPKSRRGRKLLLSMPASSRACSGGIASQLARGWRYARFAAVTSGRSWSDSPRGVQPPVGSSERKRLLHRPTRVVRSLEPAQPLPRLRLDIETQNGLPDNLKPRIRRACRR